MIRPAHAVGDRFQSDYAKYVDPKGLSGARLGIARKFFADNAPLNAFLDGCVATLKSAGAVIVDPADLPLHGTAGAAEQEVMLYEFKADLNAYLSRLPPTLFPVRSLAALIRFNEAHKDTEMPLFDQELLRQAAEKGPLTEKAYKDARAALSQGHSRQRHRCRSGAAQAGCHGQLDLRTCLAHRRR